MNLILTEADLMRMKEARERLLESDLLSREKVVLIEEDLKIIKAVLKAGYYVFDGKTYML